MVQCMIFFFFSSRRRHTRLVSDWSSDVCSSDLGSNVGTRAGRALLVAPPGKPGKSLLFQNHRDGWRAERVSALSQRPADVVDREILLAQADNGFPHSLFLGDNLWAFDEGDEESSARIPAKLVAKDPETARCVAETTSGLGRA